jgi:chloramphenicol 3-O phosphotransferase
MAAQGRSDARRAVDHLTGTFVAGAGAVTCLAHIVRVAADAWAGLLVLGGVTFAIRGRYLRSRRAGYGFVLAVVDHRLLARLHVRADRLGLTLRLDAGPPTSRRPEDGAPARIRLERRTRRRRAIEPSSPCHASTMATTGTIVYLNGVAASGKTTLAKALQAAWPEPFLHVGLDLMTATMPQRFLGSGPDADVGARWVTDDDGRLLRVDAGPFGLRLLHGLPRLAAALARAGNNVIVDDVLLYSWRVADVARALAGLDAHFVEVRCDREVALARGKGRPGRGDSTDMIHATYDDTYANDRYDLRIDTGRTSPEACAALLVTYLSSGTAPSALRLIAAAAG